MKQYNTRRGSKMIIDAHIHLGKDLIYEGRDTTEESILKALGEHGVDKAVIYPANSNTGLEDERARHNEVKEFCDKYPGKFVGICSVNPNIGAKKYMEEINKYIKQGFEGINVNPLIHAWDPTTSKGEQVFSTAQKFNVPLLINTGIGIPFGLPVKLYYLCKKYDDVKVIIVHAGHSMYDCQYLILGKECPNVYFETSEGPNMRTLKNYIKTLGAHRVMMASETLDEIAHSLYAYRHAGMSEEELEWCLGKTAKSVFKGLKRGVIE